MATELAAVLPSAQPGSATVDQLLRAATRTLANRGTTPRLDAELLLAHALGAQRETLYRRLFDAVPEAAAARFNGLLAERQAGRPVAQLTGERGFWDFVVQVTGATLVPRPETELLVERALARLPADRPLPVADLGTGTGVVALAIARERPSCRVLATDLSPRALAVARRNARCLGATTVRFRQGDWYAALTGRRFDLLVANPPYIAAPEWAATGPELAFEPRLALAGGRDGLDAFRTLIRGAPAHLQPGGWLLLEHGHTQGPDIRALLRQAGFTEITTTPDLAGRPRVSEGRRGAGG